VPLRDLVNKFAHVRFEPSGFTGNSEIPIAKSIVDYIFRWLGSRFLGTEDKAALGLIDRSALVDEPPAGSAAVTETSSAPEAIAIPVQDEAPAAPKPAEDRPQAVAVAAAPDETKVVANGHAANGNGHAVASNGTGKPANGSGVGTVTLSLGSTNVAFKVQEDAPSCADCGSIMIRNGSCYKCLNCGSTSGCS
jgi:ribonucleoside-diphosphate reductase alpha chain